MALVVSTGQKLPNPNVDDIRRALTALDVKKNGEGFAILERDRMTYLQVSGDKSIGFDMEYQDGEVQKHFRAIRGDFSLEEAVQALVAYRDQSIDWSKYGEWTRITW